MSVSIDEVTETSDQAFAAANALLPALSSSAKLMERTDFDEMVSDKATHLLFARDENGEVIGMLSLVIFRIPTGVRAWIEDVVVSETARGQGVGELICKAALEVATKHGSRTVDLTSRPSREAANRLYQRVGFSVRETNVYRYSE